MAYHIVYCHFPIRDNDRTIQDNGDKEHTIYSVSSSITYFDNSEYFIPVNIYKKETPDTSRIASNSVKLKPYLKVESYLFKIVSLSYKNQVYHYSLQENQENEAIYNLSLQDDQLF